MPPTAPLIALTILLESSVTIVTLDGDAALEPRGIFVTADRRMHVLARDGAHSVTLADGTVYSTRLVNAVLGCHRYNDIRHDRRTAALFLTDVRRERLGVSPAGRIRSPHAAFVETEVQERFHARHRSAPGTVAVAPPHEQARAMLESVALHLDGWGLRSASRLAACRVLTAFDLGAWGAVRNCWSNEAERFGHLGTAAATTSTREWRPREDSNFRPAD